MARYGDAWTTEERSGMEGGAAAAAAVAAENGTNWFTAAGKACSHYGGREAVGEMHVGKTTASTLTGF